MHVRKTATNKLERMHHLLAFLGNPQEAFKVIHVAGTSGKTSTATYCSQLLKAAGCNVGLTVSPHTIEMNERVQINGVPLPEAEFCSEFEQYIGQIERSTIKPTYFELLLGFALWEFARKRVEYAVVEVGIGGLWDTTNVLTRADKVCVITDIGLDHTDILGTTLPEIAAQKAGIIHGRNVAFMHDQGREVTGQILERARLKQADVHLLTDHDTQAPADLPLFQQRNFSLALAAINYTLDRDGHAPLSPKQRLSASRYHMPGRMETFTYSGKTIIIDGAHNGQKLGALLGSVASQYPDTRYALLLGFIDGHDAITRAHDCLQAAAKHSISTIIVTQFGGPQDAPHVSMPVGDIIQIGRELGMRAIVAEVLAEAAFEKLLSAKEPIVIASGSFYLLNHIRPLVLAKTNAK